jgi:hypothetical protein
MAASPSAQFQTIRAGAEIRCGSLMGDGGFNPSLMAKIGIGVKSERTGAITDC